MDVWAEVRAEREELADFLETLGEEQWNAPTLCDRWRVRDLVAHLILTSRASLWRGLAGLLRHGFNVHRMIAEEAIARGREPTARLLEDFRATVPSRSIPPGFRPIQVLEDVLVHAQDIRRPLGLPLSIPEHRLVAVADFVKHRDFPLGARRRIAGLRLRATDLDWCHGHGPEVRGPGEALLLAMCGRAHALGDLEGEGLPLLASRF